MGSFFLSVFFFTMNDQLHCFAGHQRSFLKHLSVPIEQLAASIKSFRFHKLEQPDFIKAFTEKNNSSHSQCLSPFCIASYCHLLVNIIYYLN